MSIKHKADNPSKVAVFNVAPRARRAQRSPGGIGRGAANPEADKGTAEGGRAQGKRRASESGGGDQIGEATTKGTAAGGKERDRACS